MSLPASQVTHQPLHRYLRGLQRQKDIFAAINHQDWDSDSLGVKGEVERPGQVNGDNATMYEDTCADSVLNSQHNGTEKCTIAVSIVGDSPAVYVVPGLDVIDGSAQVFGHPDCPVYVGQRRLDDIGHGPRTSTGGGPFVSSVINGKKHSPTAHDDILR